MIPPRSERPPERWKRVCGVRAIKNVIAVQLSPLYDEQDASTREFILETARSTARN